MRLIPLVLLPLAACADGGSGDAGNPLLAPLYGISSAVGNAVYDERRGAVELFVKTHHSVLVREIANGGGPLLDAAFETAGVPQADRPARRIQLQRDAGLYSANPGALVMALLVYG